MPETVLIEFIGNAKSGVAAAQEQVAANKEVEASAKRASASTAAASKSAAASMTAAGASMSKVGKSMTKYISLPLLGIGAASAKMSLDFNRSMLLISTQAGGTRKEVEHLSKAVLDLTAKGRFAQGPKELSEALFHIESVGIRGAKAMKTLKAASDLATVGNADLEATTNALVGAMRTGIKGTTDMRETIGTMNATIGAGNLRMDELTAAFGTGFLVSAKQVGLSLRDAGAALAELTSQGIPATSAATRLRMSFTLMAAPTEKAKKALESIGLNSESLAEQMQKPGGLVKALALLKTHLSDLSKIEQTQLLAEAFGGARSGTTIMALVGQLGDLAKKYGEVGKNAGDFGKKLKETAEDPAVQWEKSWAKIQGALIEFGNAVVPAVMPVLKELTKDITAVAGAFDGLSPGMKSFVIEAGIAAIAAGPLLRVFGGITTMAGKAGKALGLFEAITAAGGIAGGAAGGATAAEGAAAGVGATGIFGGLFKSSGGVKGAAQVAGRGLAALVGGYFVAELGVQIGKKIGVGDPTEGQGIFTSLTHGFKTSGAEAEGDLRVQGFKPTLDPDAKHRLIESWQKTMTILETDGTAGMEQVNKDLEAGLKKGSNIWLVGGQKWRTRAAETMKAAVNTIERGMDDGTINVQQGQKRINQLLSKIHLVKGDDPFGLAKATAKSFKETNGLTESGVKAWKQKLEEMPKGARNASRDATEAMLKTWAAGHPKLEREINDLTSMVVSKFGATNKQLREGVKKGATGPIAVAFHEAALGIGGALENIGTNTQDLLRALGMHSIVEFQAKVLGPNRSPQLKGSAAGEAHHHGQEFKKRGGPIHGDRPTGDTVPAMLEHGEYVLNKEAVAKVGKGTLDAINFDVAPRFAKGGGIQASGHGAGAVGLIGKGSILKAMQAAQHFINAHAPKGPPSTGGAAFGPAGIGSYKGVSMANWVIEALQFAASRGVAPQPTSGYRSHAQNVSEGRDYFSEHEKTQYPGGAVDFGGMIDPASLPKKMAVVHATRNFKYPLLAPIGFRDDGHASGTGHQLGGLIQMLAGGGVVLPVGQTLINNGLDYKAAAGILGNAWRESRWDPAAVGTGGGGLWGFTTSPISLADLQAYAAAKGKSWTDPVLQTHFMLNHLSGGLKGRLNALGSVSDTTKLFMDEWERPGIPALGERIEGGQKALKILLGGAHGGSGSAPSAPAKQVKGHYTEYGVTKGQGAEIYAKSQSYKVQTGSLSFPSLPSSIAGCRRELTERRNQLAEYKAAISKTKDRATKQALEANVKAIKKRIKELLTEITKQLRERRQKQRVHKIESRGLFPEIVAAISSRERAYNEANEYADQVVSLEPENNAAVYITGKEAPAFANVLGTEAAWRNSIIGGEEIAGVRLRGLEGQLESIMALRSYNPKAFNKQKFRIPALRTAIASVKQIFSPITAKSFAALRAGQYTPASGEFEDSLVNLQGFGKSRQLMPELPSSPEAGSFGGLIFDTQMTIRELGLKIKQAGEGEGPDQAALLEAERTLKEQAIRGQRLAELQYGPFSEFLKHMPPYIGAFKTGTSGPLPGGVNQAYTATVHGGEQILPAGSGGGETHIHLYGDMTDVVDARVDGLAKTIDRRMGQNYRRITYGPGGRKR